MKTRIIVAVIGVPVIFVILFFLPPVFLAGFVAIISAVASYELLHAVCGGVNRRVYIYSAVSGAAIPFTMLLSSNLPILRGILVLLASALFIEAIISFGSEVQLGFDNICYALFIGFLYPIMMSSLVSLKTLDSGRLYVLLPVIVTFCCDSGAYFAGVYLGKHKITPHVSPNKSAEGFIGGLAAGIVCVLIYGIVLYFATDLEINFFILALYGLVGSFVVELGDLAFSVIKRQHGIKDYGNLIPGHGGMLDRFDSMSFAAPIICALVSLLPAF